MRLYYAPNTIAVAVGLALEEAGIDYEPVLVDFKSGAQHGPDYLAINPKGRVPALDVGRDVLTEAGAILEFIGAHAHETRLIPQEAWAAARMRGLMYYLASTMHVNHAHKFRGHRWADRPESHADMAAKVAETMRASADFVQGTLAGPFVLGSDLTLADAYLYPIVTWLPGDGVPLQDFPKLARWKDDMDKRASVMALRSKGLIT